MKNVIPWQCMWYQVSQLSQQSAFCFHVTATCPSCDFISLLLVRRICCIISFYACWLYSKYLYGIILLWVISKPSSVLNIAWNTFLMYYLNYYLYLYFKITFRRFLLVYNRVIYNYMYVHNYILDALHTTYM